MCLKYSNVIHNKNSCCLLKIVYAISFDIVFAQRIFNGLVRNTQLEQNSNKENNPDFHQTISPEHEVINDGI